jgi:endogenous inhibitor of DNA gyrase (YacG/DUF329 family)
MSEKIADLAARRAQKNQLKQPKCPICRKPALAASRPFCSERCRKIDLDRWRSEAYRVPVVDEPDEDAPGARDEDKEGA